MRWLLLSVVGVAFCGLSVGGDRLGAARELVAGGIHRAMARTSDPSGRDAPPGRGASPSRTTTSRRRSSAARSRTS